jgi:hypothetical protein
VLLPIFACLLSCAEPVSVFVEAEVSSAPAKGAHVVLTPGDPRIPRTDPTFLYLSGIVTQALIRKGLQPASTPGDGAILVGIEWLREPPKMVSQAALMQESGNFRGVPPSLYASQTHVRGIAGEESLGDLSPSNDPIDKSRKVTVYPWTVRLNAMEPGGTAAAPLWRVTASGDGATRESADILPELVAAALPFIGVRTDRRQVRVAATDAVVKAIVAGSPKAGPATPVGTGF